MDFITRKQSLEDTERLYGKQSKQYALHIELAKAEHMLESSKILALSKKCKKEYIVIRFHVDSCSNKVEFQIKSYYKLDNLVLRDKKVKSLNRSIRDLVYIDVYNLIVNEEYEIMDDPWKIIGGSVIWITKTMKDG